MERAQFFVFLMKFNDGLVAIIQKRVHKTKSDNRKKCLHSPLTDSKSVCEINCNAID